MTSSQDSNDNGNNVFTLDESMLRLVCLYCACLITNTSLTYPERQALNYAELFTLFVKSGARHHDIARNTAPQSDDDSPSSA